MDKRAFYLRDVRCQCTFDLLKDFILLKCPKEFIPAMFLVKAEWSLHLTEAKMIYKTPPVNFLEIPPATSAVTVVCELPFGQDIMISFRN